MSSFWGDEFFDAGMDMLTRAFAESGPRPSSSGPRSSSSTGPRPSSAGSQTPAAGLRRQETSSRAEEAELAWALAESQREYDEMLRAMQQDSFYATPAVGAQAPQGPPRLERQQSVERQAIETQLLRALETRSHASMPGGVRIMEPTEPPSPFNIQFQAFVAHRAHPTVPPQARRYTNNQTQPQPPYNNSGRRSTDIPTPPQRRRFPGHDAPASATSRPGPGSVPVPVPVPVPVTGAAGFATSHTPRERVHVFVDYSNVYWGCQLPRGARFNVRQLVKLIEGPRFVATRVVAGSDVSDEAVQRTFAPWVDCGYKIMAQVRRPAESYVDQALMAAIINVFPERLASGGRPTIALVSGDGNEETDGSISFPRLMRLALENHNFNVEVWCFAKTRSRAYLKLQQDYPGRVVLYSLDRYRGRLVM